ncbi:MAG TPA: ATP-grasp domain-containing protein [Thermoanaerobaculia bacterium]|nr:ATP-grasp domain-containing protein [Thermoanaerobaculia bacterium]
MSPRVAILGASRYNSPVIAHIGAIGFETLVIDGNASAHGFAFAHAHAVADIRDPQSLRAAIDAHGRVDGIVTLGEPGVRPAARVCAELGLPTISEDAAHIVTSKIAMRRAWDAIPQFSVHWRAVRTEDEALEAAEVLGYPVVVKPDRTHGGSRGVTRADDRLQLVKAFAFAKTSGFSEDVIVEQFLVSISEHSAEVLVENGRATVIAIGEKVKTPPPYRVDLSVRYPATLDVDEMCKRAVDAVGITIGAAHIEFARTREGPRLLELGARCGGGHTPLIARHVSGVDEIAEVCRLACGLTPRATRAAARGADYRFLAFPPGVYASSTIPAEVRDHPDVCDVDLTLQPGGEIRNVRAGGDRAGFVVTFGDTREDAVRLADWASEQIRVTYADGSVRGPS